MGLCVWNALRGAYDSVPGVNSNALSGHAVRSDGGLVPVKFGCGRDALACIEDGLAVAAVAKNGRGKFTLFSRSRTEPGAKPRRPRSVRLDGLSAQERLDALLRFDVPEALRLMVIASST